ncbi:chemotaxis protein CheA [Thermodesulforhabdus norvegica]|uniref:Chemotaxis protein CheA n=1 Tax=Thermodesulforhabdus norvegica TaxID=39841 RepID=A0A1I4V606_9BACT|nr:chemotaxis protein CheA [Thermodesulforhabdus norvegica]SFM96646.1 two-component system, chemotaxis family, sensor kinase CheA [Thermodesulforhabdus norvegica]
MVSDLVEEFLDDARMHVDSLEQALLRLEEKEDDEEVLGRLYRAVHSLKGSSYYMGFQHLGSILHRLEDALQPYVKNRKPISGVQRDALFRVLDYLKGCLSTIATKGEDEEVPADVVAVVDNFDSPEVILVSEESKKTAETPADVQKSPDVINPDEYDPELYEIFLETLQERLDTLFSLLRRFVDRQEKPDLEELSTVFERLEGSGRYMDHEPLVHLFERWKKDLTDGLQGDFSADGLYEMTDRYLKDLERMVPGFDGSGFRELIGVSVEVPEEIEEEPEIPEVEEEELTDALSMLDRHIEEAFSAWSDIVEEEEVVFSVDDQKREPELEYDVEEVVEPREPEEEVLAPQLLKVDPIKVDQLLNRVGELVIRRSEFDVLVRQLDAFIEEWRRIGRLRSDEGRMLTALRDRFQDALSLFGRLTTELQDSVMRIRMLPLVQLFNRFPRAVRDHAKQLGKEVRLLIHGGETELDRYILEQLYEPMLHILRNAVAHGIETPEERERRGKPRRGTITIDAYYRNQMVYIEVFDDGRGIDTEKLKEILVKEGYYTEKDIQNMTEAALLETVFLPGVSTAFEANESAGRGMGLDIVRSKCRSLNGHVYVRSKKGEGAKFIIEIPLTLAIIPALLVKIGKDTYTLPLSSVVEVYSLREGTVKRIKNSYAFVLEDKTVPLLFPEQFFPRLFDGSESRQGDYVVIVRTPNAEVGLVVDEFIGHQEVVIKPIEDVMAAIHGYAGATILGDGSISLILDVSGLIERKVS